MKRGKTRLFDRYIGIDYSGAKLPVSGLPGLRVYESGGEENPVEVLAPVGRSKHWSRQGIAHWLVEQLRQPARTIVGIDHGFSFPIAYFDRHGLVHDWSAFVDDFCAHWPADCDVVSVEDVRRGRAGNGAARLGDSKWKRRMELRAGAAKSVFHFDVQGSVAKSTHAGLPWLRFIRASLGDRAHFWPFDGWEPVAGRSVIAEVYPSLWSGQYERARRSADQHDAWSVAKWLAQADGDGALRACFEPRLTDAERAIASVEGWILGLP